MLKKWTFCIALCAFAVKAVGVEWLPEIKAGYFFPTDHRFKEIYGGGGIYSLEVSVQTWRGLYSWANASYFSESGHSNQKSRTTITLVPTQIGLKYLFNISDRWSFYVGLGAAPTYLNIKDHSNYVISSVHKWGIGGVAKAGLIVNTGRFFFDIFGDYSFTTIHFHNTHHGRLVRHDADVSGWTLGAGIGYRFGSPKKKTKTKTSPTPGSSAFLEEITPANANDLEVKQLEAITPADANDLEMGQHNEILRSKTNGI